MRVDYLTIVFTTLMILSGLVTLMIVNRDVKIPATKFFVTGIILLLVITVLDAVKTKQYIAPFEDAQAYVRSQTFLSAIIYILRPFLIMIQVLIIVPDKKYKLFCVLPALINAVIYSTAFTGSHLAFYLDENRFFYVGKLGNSIFISQIFYIILLLIFSFSRFQKKNRKQSIIILTMLLLAIIDAILEYKNILTGLATPVTAFCMLEYYIYLSVIYRNEITENVTQKELEITQKNLQILRNQIQPHFIYNTLGIIRSLAKYDSKAAVKCIDNFSKYLKAHISTIQNNDLIPFEEELKNVRIYLSLVQIDYTDKIEIHYDLKVTDFFLPPLSLEPIIENAVNHGISREGGILTIRTYEENDRIMISVSDNGTAGNEKEPYTPFHNGIGLDNTRKRLELQCNGTLELTISDSGAVANISLPKTQESEGD